MTDTRRLIRYSITILMIVIVCYSAVAHNQSHTRIKSKKVDQPASKGFRLTGRAEKDVLTIDEPFNLELTIRNVSHNARFILETSATEQYRLTVLDETGDPVRLTKYGEMELKPRHDHLGQIIKTIKPGEESRNTIEVNKLYDMSSPGTYSITAQRTVYKDSRETELVDSNIVSVKFVK